MKILLTLTLSGSVLALLLLCLRYVVLRRMPSTVYYYAWLLVLLRFAVPLPGLIPTAVETNLPEAAVSGQSVLQDHNDQLPDLLRQNTVPDELPAASSESNIPAQPAEMPGMQLPATSSKTIVDWRSSGLWLSVWAIGAVLSLGLTVFPYLKFTHRLRHELHRPDRFTRELYASVPGRKPSLFRSGSVRTPLMFGVFSPKIVLPENAYDDELLSNILRHELMHYRRFDTLYKWVAVAILSAHWFNPLSWFILKELNRACELSCDEMLLRSMTKTEKQSYGNTLLSMAATSALPAGVVATTFATEKRNLKERLVQIMHYKKSRARTLAAVLALVLLIGCGMAAGPAAGKAEANEAPAAQIKSNTVHVTNVDELLAAIAPDTVIELAAGEYDLSTASDYGEDTHSAYYSWNGAYDGFELVLHNVDNLTLRGAGKGDTVIAAVPRYANVINFIGCRNLAVAALTAGHTTEPGQCAGGVLRLESCTNGLIDACGLYGCGTVGIQAIDSSGLKVTDSDIYECSYAAIVSDHCWDVTVSGCDIHHHGTREGQGDAINIFSVSYSEGFTVYNCRIHDNKAQYLLNSSYTKNALFLSNDVVNNAFGAPVFTFQQYGATVDGCRFENKDVSHGWYTGNGTFATDIEGNALVESAQFAEMMLRDIPPEKVTPKPATLLQAKDVPAGWQVQVRTVDEFLSAIGPDRTIVLDGELFDLSTASNYGGIGTEYYYWMESHDGPELVIHDVNGLTIHTLATAARAGITTIAAIPRWANVLSFRNCNDLMLINLTAGHTAEPGACSGGVLHFQNCNNVRLEGMHLYGCGILGIQASQCTNMQIWRTEIYECSQGAAQFFQTDGISFIDCDIHDVPSPAFHFTECGDKTWNGKAIAGLNGLYDVNADGTLSAPMYEDGASRERSEFHGGVEDLENAFANEPTHLFQDGFPSGAEFAAIVQQAIVSDDWASLADRITFPLQFFTTDHYSFVIHDREEYLGMARDGYFANELFTDVYRFRERIANADTAEYGSCVYGATCLDHLIAFSCIGNEPTVENLRINAISVLIPFWPGRSAEGSGG